MPGSFEGEPVREIASTRFGVDSLVTAVQTAGGFLKLNLWELDAQAAWSSITSKAEATAGGADNISVCRLGTDMVATAVRTREGELKIIIWQFGRAIIPPPGF